MTFARLVALLWTLGILAACSIPGDDLPDVDIVSIDKVAHFFLFAVYGWLWMRALRGPLMQRARWVVLSGVVYAVLTEIYQGFLPWERIPDPYDAIANILGLFVAVLLYRRRHGPTPASAENLPPAL